MELPRGAARLTGRVLESAAGIYRVHVGDRVLECPLRGRVKRDPGGRVTVGDLVVLQQLPDGGWRIEEVLPRQSRLSRRSSAGGREQLIAANVDQVAAVTSVSRPPPDFHMLDRLLAVAELDELAAFIVLNKIDRSDRPRLPEDFERYAAIGYPILLTSAKERTGLETLRERLAGRISVFTGPSGAGKSSLLNALVPGLRLRVAGVGERSGRGRHTTVSARLIPLPDGGYLADTPGIQHFRPSSLAARDLAGAFREFRGHVGQCRFADCLHRAEPGCAVRRAIEEGEVDERRYAAYRDLLAAADEELRQAGGGRG